MYKSNSCQPGSRVIRAFPDVEKFFSDTAVKDAKPENIKKNFSTSTKAQINSRVKKFY